MKIDFASWALVVLMITCVSLGQTTRRAGLSTKPAARTIEEKKIDMSKVKVLLEKANEASNRGSDEETNRYLSELTQIAQSAEESNEFDVYERIFLQILKVNGHYPAALFGLAELYRRTNPVLAGEYYTKYMQDNPGDPAAYFGRGTSYLTRDAYSLAIDDLKYLVEQLDPNNIQGLTNLAIAVYKKGNDNQDPETFKQAVDYMKRAVVLAGDSPKEEHKKLLPELYLRLGDIILASAQIAKVDSSEAIMAYEQGVQLQKEICDKDPQNRTELSKIIALYEAIGRAYGRQIAKDSNNASVYIKLAQITQDRSVAVTRDAQAAALELYQKAVKADPSISENWFLLAKSYLQVGNAKEAGLAIDKAIKLDSHDARFKTFKKQLPATTKPAK